MPELFHSAGRTHDRFHVRTISLANDVLVHGHTEFARLDPWPGWAWRSGRSTRRWSPSRGQAPRGHPLVVGLEGSGGMTEKTRQIRLVSRPTGWPTHEDFELVEVDVPQLQPGQVLVRNTVMSVDPYMR